MSTESKTRRIRLEELVGASFRSGRTSGRGMVQNVSYGGVFVRSPLLLPRGASIDAQLTTRKGHAIRIHGTVRWNTASCSVPLSVCGFGMCVTRPSEEFLDFVSGVFRTGDPAPR